SSIGAVNGGNGLVGFTPGCVTGVVLGASGVVTSGFGYGSAANGLVIALAEDDANPSPTSVATPAHFIRRSVSILQNQNRRSASNWPHSGASSMSCCRIKPV